MKKNRLIHLLLIFPMILFAQSKAITGTVIDENKMPLPGVSILIKDLKIGSFTDFDGLFSLTVPEAGKTLVFSYLGYITKELVIGNKRTFNIQLEIDTNNTLEEIVVVGYGSQRKSDITGSVASVKVDDIAAAQNSTVDALLQGRAAGVQVTQNAGSPGSGVSVKIRGASSLRGNNEPLYVIDGVIISSAGEDAANASTDVNSLEETQNGLNGINPRDIESIEVLKDASATAIYGSRGANGVILITTKKGKSGKTSIQAYVNTSVSEITERYDVLDAFGYANYQNEALLLIGGAPRFSISDTSIFPIAADGTVSDTAAEQHNWHDEIYKQGFSKSTGASFSGGTEKGNYYASVGYNDQGGIVENSRLQNGNFSINLNQDLSDKFSISAKLNAFYSNGNFAQDGDRAGIGATETIDFLDEFSKSGENFFLAFGLYRPHVPFVAPKKYFDLYDINDFKVPQSTDDYLNTIPKPAAISVRRKKEQVDLDPDLAKEIKHAYYATISFVDAQIGRVLDKLKETGLDKNTIVVFTSDHGYHLGEHGHWQKQTLFEDGTRVPLIIAGPGIKNNKEIINNPVELVDLYPTIMDLVQMQTPKFVSGKSIVPLLENSENIVRESALTELQINTGNGLAQGYSIKTKRYRLSQWEHKGIKGYELYDHFSDTSELTNLAEDLDYQKIRDSLIKTLDNRILNAKKVPLGLGRQINNAKPWLEPKIIRSKPK